MNKLPTFVRRFIYDAAQGVITAVIVLNLAIPGSLDEARGMAVIVATGAIRAVFGAAAMAAPRFMAYLATRLAITPELDEPPF